MTTESIYSIHKKERVSPLFNILMELMTHLRIMKTILSINIMHHFYYQITMNIYLLDQNMIQRHEEYVVIKNILGLFFNKSKSFECQVSLLFFVINNKKLSSHMAQISEHINYSNQKNIPMIIWGK